jgi:hypothetical protein
MAARASTGRFTSSKRSRGYDRTLHTAVGDLGAVTSRAAGIRDATSARMKVCFQTLDGPHLDIIRGGASDPLGPTVLVAGRPQTREAIYARNERLFARAYDPRISDAAWLRQWRLLYQADKRLPD